MIIKVGFEDNPWFMHDQSLREEYEKDLQKKNEGRMSEARFNHIWHGAFNDDIDNSVIKADWFDACIDAHKKLGFEAKGGKVLNEVMYPPHTNDMIPYFLKLNKKADFICTWWPGSDGFAGLLPRAALYARGVFLS